MKIYTHLIPIAITLMATSVLSSCTDDNDKDNHDPSQGALNAVMTYNGNFGETSSFTYYSTTSDTPQPYTSAIQPALSSSDIGKRVAMRFTLNGEQSGTINVINLNVLPTAILEMVEADVAEANNKPVEVVSLDRTGPYLNLYAKLPAGVDHQYSIMCDRSTYGTSEPHLYLSITKSEEPSGTTLATLSCYDISQVWSSSATRKVVVHINNTTSGGATTFTFSK